MSDTYAEIPAEERERIEKELVLKAFDLVAEKALGGELDYLNAYQEIAVQLTYQLEQMKKQHEITNAVMDGQLESCRTQLEQAEKEIEKLCWEVEKLPASDLQTQISSRMSTLLFMIRGKK